MTARERFAKTLRFETKGLDRLPMVEWAPWWDLTLKRWQKEGLPAESGEETQRRFGLDEMVVIAPQPILHGCPRPAAHGGGIVENEEEYQTLRRFFLQDEGIAPLLAAAKALKPRHDRGEVIVRLWLDGFFWFPRTLLGIEPHLYAFYDQGPLLHRMNTDLTAFNRKAVAALAEILRPDMVGFAEDMSYNRGPMLSKESFDEFLLPYYHQVIADVKSLDIPVLVDSDGDISAMVPWFMEAGIQGVYPLERQAGVDMASLRQKYPTFLFLGGYDKMVMSKGEEAMRAEFERLLPAMRKGGFVPSVDHQTPPEVSLENYHIYLRLFAEYCRKAVA